METKMSKAARDQNVPRLIAVWILNSFVFLLIFFGREISINILDPSLYNFRFLIFGPLAVAFTAIINGLIGTETKARIVYFRWDSPSPETRVFSELIQDDKRIDKKGMEMEIRGVSKLSAEEQNALWFENYMSVQNNPLVVSSERNYVYYRDYASTLAILLALAICASLYFSEKSNLIVIYIILLLIQLILVKPVAARSGNEFVTTVIAVSFTQEFRKQKRPIKKVEEKEPPKDEESHVDIAELDKRFSPRKKRDAVQRVLRGENIVDVAQDLDVPTSLLQYWRNEYFHSRESKPLNRKWRVRKKDKI